MTDFLRNQPHPETQAARCTTDAGVPIRPATNTDAVLCCAISADNKCILYVVAQNSPTRIDVFYRSQKADFFPHGVFFEFPTPVKSMNTIASEGKGYIFVLADSAYLIDAQGCVVWKRSLQAEYASAFLDHSGRLYLICDNTLFTIKDTSLVEAGEISIPPYYINPNRYDLLFRPGTMSEAPLGTNILFWDGMYLCIFAQTFHRCARRNLDTFMCISRSLNESMSRRFLLIPNGGVGSLFVDEDGDISIAYVGSTQFSVTYGKPTVTKLVFQDIGFFRPCSGFIFENSPVDMLRPLDIGGIDIRDTFIYPAPDGWYYLTGTTARAGGTFWENTNGILLWRSRDLSHWTFIGKVFDYQLQDSWQKNIGSNCWAPEMCYYQGTYWITYSIEPGCGLLKSISGKPEGPYADMGRVVMRGIDSGFFLDDDTLYLVWQNGMIAPFSQNCNSFTQEPVQLLPEDGQQVGYEGAGIIKVDGKYVLYAAEWNGDMRIDGTYDMMYATSDSLFGPYSHRKPLVPHGGHGCLFYDFRGNLRYTIFGNDRTAPFSRSAAIGSIGIKWVNNDLILYLQNESADQSTERKEQHS